LSATNTRLVLLCQAAEVAQGETKRVSLPDLEPLAIYHLEDGFYVTDDICTHGQASLAEGCIEQGEIECPAHGGRFEIRTGIPVGFPAAIPIRCYPAKVSDGKLYAEVPISPGIPSKSED
jgi:nitrite reductase/ring-hydroxylating ferredoxin subunit